MSAYVTPIINTFIGGFTGLASGAGAVISQYFGAKNDEKVRNTVCTALLLTILLSAIFTFDGVNLTPTMLRIAKTPEDVFPESRTYLTIYFAGVAGLLFYNMSAAILRAVGNSVRPFMNLVIAAAINVALDLLLVIHFHMGVRGVAYATIFAQGVSALLTIAAILREESSVKVSLKHICFDYKCLKRILSYGFPACVQMSVVCFSNVFIQSYGFITDYLSEFMREMRKEPWGDLSDPYFRFGSNLNQRDTIAVRKMVSGFAKLLYPDGSFTKEDIAEILTYSMEMRRRVKEQLKKIGGMEFYDVNFSYIDNETFEEKYVSVPEQGGGKLIPDGIANPGTIYTVSRSKSSMVGVYRLETQMLPGNGKFERTGLGADRDAKEAANTAFNFLKANGMSISRSISTTQRDYIINYQDLNGIGMTKSLALPTLLAIASAALGKPTLGSLAVLGEISISGAITKVDELANVLQVCLDSGAKKVLLPITSAADLGTVPPDLMGAFSIIFYTTAQEAVFKALGVE